MRGKFCSVSVEFSMKDGKKRMSVDFGKRVKIARKKAGYTQSQLAELVDVSVNHISAIERGIYETRVDTLKRMADALGTTTDYLVYGEENEDGPLARAFLKANRMSEDDQAWIADYIEAILSVKQERK